MKDWPLLLIARPPKSQQAEDQCGLRLRNCGLLPRGGGMEMSGIGFECHSEEGGYHRRSEWSREDTFARAFLPNEAGCPHFINAKLIAACLSPFAPERAAVRAGRIILDEISQAAADGDSFAFETTLSGLVYARRITGWRGEGYTVKLIFLKLSSVEEASARVAMRVRSLRQAVRIFGTHISN